MYDMYSFTWSCTYSTISASPSKFSITFHSLGIFWHCFWCFWCFGVGLPVCLRLQCPWGHWMEILFSSSRRTTSPRSPRGMSASERVHRTNIPGWMRHKLNSLGLNFQRPPGNCTRRRLSFTLMPTTCPMSPFFTSSSTFCHLTKAPNCNSWRINVSGSKLHASFAKAT